MKIKNWIEHNTGKILMAESIFLLVSLSFFIKSCFFGFVPNTMDWDYPSIPPWYMYIQPKTLWLLTAFTGALSFPVFVIQGIIFYILKIEKKWRNKNIILIIISVVAFFLCVAYIVENNQYSRKKRLEWNIENKEPHHNEKNR
jgi:hypothetical protein